MFGVWCLVIGLVLSELMAGTDILDATDATLINNLQAIRIANVGTWTIPILNANFFSFGIWSLMHWDWSFLAGSPLLWVFYIFNIGLVWGIFTVVAVIVTGIFNR